MTDELTLDDLPQPEFEGDIHPDELEIDEENPNEMDPELFQLLKDRIVQRGWISGPILTDTDGLIADGEHRWRAAKDIGLVEVPVKQWDVDDAGRRLIRQEANKIRGEHDPDRDQGEFEILIEQGMESELSELLDSRDEYGELDDLLITETPDFEPVGSEEQPRLDETDVEPVTCPECFHEFEP